MYRVLAPGGMMIVAAPFIFPIHHQPDFTRFTPEGMARLLAAFPVVVVFSQGDTQWPHTVYALAAKVEGPKEHDAIHRRASELVRESEQTRAHDPLLTFTPVASAVRRDTGDARPERITAGRSLEQAFECGRDGLCRIDVKLDTQGAPGAAAVQLVLVSPDGADPPLATCTVRPVSAWSQRWVAFVLPPLRDSAGRRYVFRLECPDGTPETCIAAQVARDGSLAFEAFALRLGAAIPRRSGVEAPSDRRAHSWVHRLLGRSRRDQNT